MLNYAETVSVSTNVPLSPVLHLVDGQETASLTSSLNLDNYVLLCIGNIPIGKVSPTLKDGYLAACKAYAEMEEQDEYGAYFLLTGYEYAHLT